MISGPFRTIDISGMGEGYEDACQRMLWRGVQYLAERQPPIEMWEGTSQSPVIVGVLLTEGEELLSLEKYVMAGCRGASGAMHQAVMNHLAWIHKKGQEDWLKTAEEHDRQITTWEGDLEDPRRR